MADKDNDYQDANQDILDKTLAFIMRQEHVLPPFPRCLMPTTAWLEYRFEILRHSRFES